MIQVHLTPEDKRDLLDGHSFNTVAAEYGFEVMVYSDDLTREQIEMLEAGETITYAVKVGHDWIDAELVP